MKQVETYGTQVCLARSKQNRSRSECYTSMQLPKLPLILLLRSTDITAAFKFPNKSRAFSSTAPARHPTSTTSKVQRTSSLPATAPNIEMTNGEQQQLFGRFKIETSQIFYRSIHSFAMVNLRPLVPGHVLVVSNRVVPLLSDLEFDEHDDLWRSVRSVQSALKRQYNCDAFNVAVQDGVGAGQSVPHVHVHILPRYRGDWERNDDIYDQLESWAPRDEMSVNKPKIVVPVDSERRDRTVDEMAEEALLYRSLFDES